MPRSAFTSPAVPATVIDVRCGAAVAPRPASLSQLTTRPPSPPLRPHFAPNSGGLRHLCYEAEPGCVRPATYVVIASAAGRWRLTLKLTFSSGGVGRRSRGPAHAPGRSKFAADPVLEGGTPASAGDRSRFPPAQRARVMTSPAATVASRA